MRVIQFEYEVRKPGFEFPEIFKVTPTDTLRVVRSFNTTLGLSHIRRESRCRNGNHITPMYVYSH